MPTLDDENEASEPTAEHADDKPKRKSPPKGSLDNRAPPTIWQNSGSDANLLYDEILQAGKEKGLDSGCYKINLKQLSPRQVTLGSIPGEAVPNGDALLTYVQNVHLQSRTRGDARYEVMIQDRARGTWVSKGFLQLPDREELASQLGGPSPYAPAYAPPPSAFGYAPRAYWPPQPAPQMHQAPPQVASQPQAPPVQQQPPQAPQSHPDPYVAMLITQNAQLQEKLAYMAGQNERFFAQGGGGGGFGAAGAVPQAPEVTQQPQQTPPVATQYAPPPYMPPPGGNLEERVTHSVIERLLQLGVIQRPAAVGAAATAPQTQAPPTPAGAVGQITESLTVVRDFVKQLAAFREVGREMGAVLEPDGLGAVETEPPEPPKPPPNPEDDLPWKRIHLGPDFKWAIDKETENTSLQGVMAEMLNDEKIRDKVFEVTNKGLDFIREVYRGRPLFAQGPPQLGAGVTSGYAHQPQAGHPTQPPPNGAGGGWGSRG